MKPELIKPVFAVWIAAVGLGYGCLLNYGSTPAASSFGPSQFPPVGSIGLNSTGSNSICLNSDGLTIVAFFHPKCPCSAATVSELQKILGRNSFFSSADNRAKLKVYAVIAKPSGTGDAFIESGLVSSLASMKGVQMVIDNGDLQSRRFGARASGQIFLFDQSGRKRFSGGITAERGHEGASVGGDALSDFIAGRRPSDNCLPLNKVAVCQAPVFGCSLESHH